MEVVSFQLNSVQYIFILQLIKIRKFWQSAWFHYWYDLNTDVKLVAMDVLDSQKLVYYFKQEVILESEYLNNIRSW